ncbi:MAG: FecR family protein [Lysobacterales bacterium]
MKISKEENIEPGNDPLESVFRNVVARPKPPADVKLAVYRHTLDDWKTLRASRKRKKRIVYWSVAASILMAILVRPLLFQPQGLAGDAGALGFVENQLGNVSVFEDNGRVQPASFDSGNYVFPGQSLLTAANSGASITWGAGNSIRVDQNTELHLRSKSEIELVAGKIYVDIPHVRGQDQEALSVVTRFGSIAHIGTQFMVSTDADSVEVKVREGSVSIDNNDQVFITQKGQQTTLGESNQVSHTAILTYGPDWQWTEELAPAFVLEGKTLDEFLNWVGRETGKDILFDTKEAEDIARNTVMHGSIDDTPLLAMDIVLQTNELSWHQQDGTIFLSAGE